MATEFKYNINQIRNIYSTGFEYTIPEETIKVINYLTGQLGSQSIITDRQFKKPSDSLTSSSLSSSLSSSSFKTLNKKRKGNKSMEITNEDWESIRTFQSTKIEQKQGIDALMDQIRLNLNKLTDKTFLDIREKIIVIIDSIIHSDELNEQMIEKISSSIYEIASCNKFYSKLYADLCCGLIEKYDWLMNIFKLKASLHIEQFKTIEYFDPDKDYDKFCEMNKVNERRKANTQFFVNLALNNIIPIASIIHNLKLLIAQVITLIDENDKKNEVDELSENIAIMFDKNIISNINNSEDLINGNTIIQTVTTLAKSKSKDFKSLSNKAIFKFMDLIEEL